MWSRSYTAMMKRQEGNGPQGRSTAHDRDHSSRPPRLVRLKEEEGCHRALENKREHLLATLHPHHTSVDSDWEPQIQQGMLSWLCCHIQDGAQSGSKRILLCVAEPLGSHKAGEHKMDGGQTKFPQQNRSVGCYLLAHSLDHTGSIWLLGRHDLGLQLVRAVRLEDQNIARGGRMVVLGTIPDPSGRRDVQDHVARIPRHI